MGHDPEVIEIGNLFRLLPPESKPCKEPPHQWGMAVADPEGGVLIRLLVQVLQEPTMVKGYSMGSTQSRETVLSTMRIVGF